MLLGKIDMEKLEFAAEVFKGFGNPVRLKIIDALADRKFRVMELSEILGYPEPIISQQLKILKSVGVVKKVRDERSQRYALSNHHFTNMIKCMHDCLGMK